MTIGAVLFDFSGTLFRLEEDDSWFTGIQVDGAHAPSRGNCRRAAQG